MFSGFFNYDNPVWRFIGKFFDIMVLNFLWVLCCIPIVTAGAATTAVYYVTLKLARDEEGAVFASFFKSFRENFRQSTIIWLLMLLLGAIIGFDFYFFLMLQQQSAFRTAMLSVFGAFGVIYLCMSLYVFPLQARFYNPVRRTLINALFMSLRHLLHTGAVLAIFVSIPLLALFVIPFLIPILFLFGFPMMAFAASYLFNRIFARYIPEKESAEDRELRPLFADEEELEKQNL